MVSSQNLMEQAQVYQQQIAGIMAQKESLNQQLVEIRKALEELGKTSEKDVYRIAGPILVKADVAAVRKDLKEKEEMLDLKMATLDKGEKRIKTKIEELRGKLTKPGRSSDEDEEA